MNRLNGKNTAVLVTLMALLIVGTVAGSSYATYVQVGEATDSMDYYDDVDWFTTTLEGGVCYSIDLVVPFWADFDIKVYDENDNLVGTGEEGTGEDEAVYISPKWTGKFEIKVYIYDGETGEYTVKLYREV